ncbi:hypothetical protein [Hydrogenimonas cancrithermarum]|uniref:Uncharacterized protein n=1 Tax=Hydrogenimonas cancrithermarum TaxID=2993563 RepID=A0ABN6WVQ6_9BACT|nr:hypothetical protein [Hydrogenimonas cancrithermarum]BDY12824.1 hypothetical protein HCR_11360 [Hydrogenimonas cancrithermarum]BDY12941.1 hypothetical protein HCR_12530 [Hydrogenimonas cancrithermarum]
MTFDEKVKFLMETIPSEKEVDEIKRRYLLSGVEAYLLLDASRTLQNSTPDENLIAWAHAILRIHLDGEKADAEEGIPLQTKMERIIALFSNTEDLQRVLKHESWGASEKRALGLVSHFVANDIPLMSNVKIVEKVYDLLLNAYLPSDIASKYFGKKSLATERDYLLEKYLAYRKKSESPQAPIPPKNPTSEDSLKRYAYILGAAVTVAFIFMSGFLTAKWLYENKQAPAEISVAKASPAAAAASLPEENRTSKIGTSSAQHAALQRSYELNRVLLQKNLERFGLNEKVDFASRIVAQTAASFDLPEVSRKRRGSLRDEDSGIFRAPTQLPGPMRVSLEALGSLHGLKLPLRIRDRNETEILPLPEGFRMEAKESLSSRILYLSDGKSYYPVELYSFVGEPLIMEYRLINYKPGHFIPVPSNIWHFSDIGEMRMHKHFIYLKNRLSPAKIITTHFLPGGGTVELVSLGKIDRDKTRRELLLERTDYLPSGKLLYREGYDIERVDGRWRSRLVRQVWYEEGRKIRAKGVDARK